MVRDTRGHLSLAEGSILSSTTRASTIFAPTTLSFLIWVATCGAGQPQARGGPTPSPAGAAVYFIDLKNGDTVPGKLTIHFGLRGMGVAPAGADRPNSGHPHLINDSELPPLDQPIPNHFNPPPFCAGPTQPEIKPPP